MSRFDGAFGLVSDSGHPATQPSNNPPCFRYSMKNGSWPSGVTAAPSPFSHSTWTRPANVSAITDRSLPYSTDGCSPAGCPAATARPVLMPLRLHGFADFANYQLPEIGSELFELVVNLTAAQGAPLGLTVLPLSPRLRARSSNETARADAAARRRDHVL